VLDGILRGLVEEEATLDQIVARGFDSATVERVQRMLYATEYKRRQAPPGVKLGARAFGRDRRYPIVNGFRDRVSANG
jgi:NAD+ synthase